MGRAWVLNVSCAGGTQASAGAVLHREGRWPWEAWDSPSALRPRRSSSRVPAHAHPAWMCTAAVQAPHRLVLGTAEHRHLVCTGVRSRPERRPRGRSAEGWPRVQLPRGQSSVACRVRCVLSEGRGINPYQVLTSSECGAPRFPRCPQCQMLMGCPWSSHSQTRRSETEQGRWWLGCLGSATCTSVPSPSRAVPQPSGHAPPHPCTVCRQVAPGSALPAEWLRGRDTSQVTGRTTSEALGTVV